MHKDERYYAGKKKKGIFQGENIELRALCSVSHTEDKWLLTVVTLAL